VLLRDRHSAVDAEGASLDRDAFGEVPRLVDVAAELDGEMVGEELEREMV
jgi:hypothetical protein